MVAATGDSVPFGAGVSDDETYPALLERVLVSAGRDIRVLNAGVPSYNLRQSLDRLNRDVLPIYANVVAVTVQAANDVSLASYFREQWTPDVTWAHIRFDWTPQGMMRLALIHYGALGFQALEQLRRRSRAEDWAAAMLDQETRVLSEGLAPAVARGIPVVLLPIDPFFYSGPGSSWKNEALPAYHGTYANYVAAWSALIADFNDRLQRFAAREPRVEFLDTRAILDGLDRRSLFVAFIHSSPAGNAVVARAIHERLVGRLPAADPRSERTAASLAPARARPASLAPSRAAAE